MEHSVGRSISHSIRHTSLPQTRSINDKLEELFGDELSKTARRKFRHHATSPWTSCFTITPRPSARPWQPRSATITSTSAPPQACLGSVGCWGA